MPWGAAIVAAGAIGGALISKNSSKAAANAQENATNSANSEQQREYDLARTDYAPYREAGANALTKLNGLMADPSAVTKDPSFGFGLSQGDQAISRSAAGAGGLYSGATLKALERYGQDYAGTKLNEAYNRYSNVAGLGQVATGGTTVAGTNAANQIGNNTTGLGNALAGNALNNGNAYVNALNGVSSYARNNGSQIGSTVGNWFSPSVTNGSDASGYNGTQNNPSAYVGP